MSTSVWGRFRQGRYRWPLRLAAVLVLALALFLWFTRDRPENHLTVENHSGQPIALLRVTVAGTTAGFQDVAAGAAVAAPFGVTGGERFTVEGKLADGTLIRASGVIREGGHFLVLPGGEVQFRPAGRRG